MANTSIILGIGFGLIYLPAIVVVSQYFECKRALATGVSVSAFACSSAFHLDRRLTCNFKVSGSGFGTFVMPLVSLGR